MAQGASGRSETLLGWEFLSCFYFFMMWNVLSPRRGPQLVGVLTFWLAERGVSTTLIVYAHQVSIIA